MAWLSGRALGADLNKVLAGSVYPFTDIFHLQGLSPTLLAMEDIPLLSLLRQDQAARSITEHVW